MPSRRCKFFLSFLLLENTNFIQLISTRKSLLDVCVNKSFLLRSIVLPASQQRRASRRMNLCPMTYFQDTQNISFNLSSDFLCFRSFLSDSDALNPNHITLCLRFVVCLPSTRRSLNFVTVDADFNNSGVHALNFKRVPLNLDPLDVMFDAPSMAS